MSGEMSDAKARAARRDADRQRAREERKAEALARRRPNPSDDSAASVADDPNDPLAAERRLWRERRAAKNGENPSTGEFQAGATQEDQLIAHAARLQAENAQTLKNTIKVARETTVVGASTIHKLDEQTEQFNRMDNTLEETNASLSRSERILRGMKSIGGAISNMFSSGSKKAPVKVGLHTTNHEAEGLSTLEAKDRERERRKEQENKRSKRNTQTTNEEEEDTMADLTNGRTVVAPNEKQSAAIATIASNQRAEDDALDELSDVLGTLKAQSEVMNQQLVQHSRILDGLGEKVDETAGRLQKGSRTMQKIS